MRRSWQRAVVMLFSIVVVLNDSGTESILIAEKPQMHATTDWHIEPSFKFDVLCFLNTLTADPYYLNYYQDEYDRFKPTLTSSVKIALINLKRRIKDENRGIISAFLCLYFSATGDETLNDMLRTLDNGEDMQKNLKQTPYYSEDGWRLFESIREDLTIVFRFLKDVGFESYWQEHIFPRIKEKIVLVEKELPMYNVIAEDEKYLGFPLPSNKITVYMLYYSQPHGIKITGTRFLTDIAWPFVIVLRNAVHEMMHPPYDLANDEELKETLDLLKEDEFLMNKVLNHNPSFGYNSFEGFIEEDCVQAIEQIVNEKLGIAREARRRWKESDNGMHVFAVALYSVMKEENYNKNGEQFRDFLIRMIRGGKLVSGEIRRRNDLFYSESSVH